MKRKRSVIVARNLSSGKSEKKNSYAFVELPSGTSSSSQDAGNGLSLIQHQAILVLEKQSVLRPEAQMPLFLTDYRGYDGLGSPPTGLALANIVAISSPVNVIRG